LSRLGFIEPDESSGERHVAARNGASYADAQTRTIAAAGATFAYRELGPQSGVPLVLLTHLGANLDGWDPRIVDGLAQDHRVIAVDDRGVGQSSAQQQDPPAGEEARCDV
jgi:pimeloyl-ACP methyl ester carboxylesterase